MVLGSSQQYDKKLNIVTTSSVCESATFTCRRFLFAMSYCVYKHTTPNGKVYIGVTGRNLELRFLNGLGYKKNTAFYRAIKKYGWNSIKHEVLVDGLTKDEAYNEEQRFIKEYDSCNPEKGYNLSVGGKGGTLGVKLSESTRARMSEGHRGIRLSDSTKEKLRALRMGSNNPNYGKHPSEETRKKLSDSLKSAFSDPNVKERLSMGIKRSYELHPERGESTRKRMLGEKNYFYGKHFCGKDHPNFGKKMSEEQRLLMSKARKHPIICVETGVVYESRKEAAEENGLNPDVLLRKIKSGEPYKGLHWEKYHADKL